GERLAYKSLRLAQNSGVRKVSNDDKALDILEKLSFNKIITDRSSEMKMHRIEIDNKVWNHLKNFAEPFTDTPNSVLNRLLFGQSKKKSPNARKDTSINIKGVPNALSQIFEVLYEMEINGLSRVQATNKVAKSKGTTPKTVREKYCTQLNKKASEIDRLFNKPGYEEFKQLLKDKFVIQKDIIEIFFESLISDEGFDKSDPDLSLESLI
ncbi:MAG: hypothetical protein JRF60_16495, partial [Deltaproteobacteria bacterium]|nr:hypothetical protein [Deltaproteobacteria bacterium]